MKAGSYFECKLSELQKGDNEYKAHVGSSFFENYEHTLIDDAEIEVEANLSKESEERLELSVRIKGTITTNCDRCATEVIVPVENEHNVLVKLVGDDLEDNDDVWYRSKNIRSLDYSTLVYDLVSVARPLRISCDIVEGKSCNAEIDSIIENLSPGEQKQDAAHPVWDKLKDMKFDN